MKSNLLLLMIVVLLAIFPLFIHQDAEFGGADGEAEAEIGNISPDYEPWFHSFWEPPSGEIESLLFSLQAALGAGFIGYFIGLAKGRNKRSSKNELK